jgi:hypothetical protein
MSPDSRHESTVRVDNTPAGWRATLANPVRLFRWRPLAWQSPHSKRPSVNR